MAAMVQYQLSQTNPRKTGLAEPAQEPEHLAPTKPTRVSLQASASTNPTQRCAKLNKQLTANHPPNKGLACKTSVILPSKTLKGRTVQTK